MKNRTLWCFLFLGINCWPGWAQSRSTGEPARSYNALQWRLRELILEFNGGHPTPSAALLRQDLDNLCRALAETAITQVDRRKGRPLVVPVKNSALFGKRPTLPPENKKNGHWIFSPVVLEARARHLFIYGLRFQASRTMRIKRVTLSFRDGSKVVHDDWAHLEDGNGKEFGRQISTPMLNAWYPGAPRLARAIDSISILGSTQDGNWESSLAFFFEIPDPNDHPFEETVTQLEALRQSWANRSMDRSGLNRCRNDLQRLAERLELPFCIESAAK